jgi:hypothetical protein
MCHIEETHLTPHPRFVVPGQHIAHERHLDGEVAEDEFGDLDLGREINDKDSGTMKC